MKRGMEREKGNRGAVGRLLGWSLGGLCLLALLAVAGLWLATPTVVGWRLASNLREAGFEEVAVETRGFGWREVEVTHLSGQTRNSELEVEGARFSYRLAGLWRGRAEEVEAERLQLIYRPEEWPDWEELAREFPLLRGDRALGDEPWAERVRVNDGWLELTAGEAEAAGSFGLRLEAAGVGAWEGRLEWKGAGVEGTVLFEVDGARNRGRWEIRNGRIDPDRGLEAGADPRPEDILEGWNFRGGALRFSGEGEWEEGRWVGIGQAWFLDWLVEGLELDVSLPSAFLEVEGVAEATAQGWQVQVEGEAQVALVLGDELEDLFGLEVSVGWQAGEWEATARAQGATAGATVWLEVDPDEEQGRVEVGRLILDLEKILTWATLFVGAEAMDEWSVTGLPIELRGSGELVSGRFDWEIGGAVESAGLSSRDLFLLLASVRLDGAGAFIWRADDWRLEAGVDLAARSVSYNDLFLRDLTGRWDGPPWDGRFRFQGIQVPRRLGVEGQYEVRRVEGDWQIEGDTELDLTLELR